MTLIKTLKSNPLLLAPIAVWLIYASAACHSGWLCGDETCAAHLSQMSLTEMPKWILFDSYPILWPLVMKCFCGLFGYSNFTIRLLGLLVQTAMLGSVLLYARLFKIVPKFTFCCFLLLPAVVNHTGSARAWGLGITTFVLFYTFLKLYLEEDEPLYSLIVVGFGIVAVQSTYYNSVLVFATMLAGAISTPKLRNHLRLIGAMIGLTMAPYVPVFLRAPAHYANLHVKFSILDFINHFSATVTDGGRSVFIVAIITGIFQAARCMAKAWPVFKFERFVDVLSIPLFAAFIVSLHYQTNPWYYLPLIVVLCLGYDAATSHDSSPRWLTPVMATLFILELPVAYEASKQPQTNIGEIIPALSKAANDHDLIVISPWHIGEMVNWYYTGKGDLLAVPNIPIVMMNVTRWDLESEHLRMCYEPTIWYAKIKIQEALEAHHSVFIVSNIEWRRMHPPAPMLAQLTDALPNLPRSFYFSFIENEQLANLVQSLGCPVDFADTPGWNPDLNGRYNLVRINPK